MKKKKFQQKLNTIPIQPTWENIKILSGTTHPRLAQAIAKSLNLEKLSSAKVGNFSNGETTVTILESMREMDVFIVQPTSTDPNNSLMELLILVDAARRASAKRIIAVIPCFGYARQDKKEKSRTPVSAKLIANMLEVSGVDRVITLDLHSSQIQGFFNIPVDNLFIEPFFLRYVEDHIPGNKVIASPGVSTTRLAKRLADNLNVSLCIIHFGQIEPGKTKDEVMRTGGMKVVGDIANKVAILVDDMADNCLMLVEMAKVLIENGASKVHTIVSHGLLSGNSLELINNSVMEEMVLTNSLNVDKLKGCPKIKVINIAPFLADAVRRIHFGESTSNLFQSLPKDFKVDFYTLPD